MEFPSNLKYTKEHEWLRIEADGTATVGITAFAQQELGDIVYVEVETVGETLDKDEIFGTVEAVKTTSDLFMPLSGKILEVNTALTEAGDDNPALVNEAPYTEGWIIKIEPSDRSELENLLSSEQYTALVG